MAAQSMRADKGYFQIIQGSPTDYLQYCHIRKLKAETLPGEFVTSAGESAGDPLDLAAAGDADTGSVELVLYRVGAIPQDIDTAIAANSYAMCLGRNGYRFKVACWRADESTSLLKGQVMALEATGQLMAWAYTDTVVATDTHLFAPELAEDSADVAGVDPIILVRF